jgi:MmyB-like transcription regulator ligand binding domain
VEVVGELALSSERFRTLWARHDVRGLDSGTATVHHPVVGELRLHGPGNTYPVEPLTRADTA